MSRLFRQCDTTLKYIISLNEKLYPMLIQLYNNLKTVGSFSRTTSLNMSSIEELTNLLNSSEYTKKIQPNGFSKYSISFMCLVV